MPRPASVLQPHDPARFERMLQMRVGAAELPWVSGTGGGD
jgi:hypothetical protein